MKLSDFVVSFIEKIGTEFVFSVTGGGAMHLNDSFSKSKKIKYIQTHHEQSAAMMSEAYSRKTGRIGVCQVTTGPGGTNAITGLVGAWIDSIPQLIISGQVATKDMINNKKIRQMGVQEINIVDLVKPVTKYAVTVRDPKQIKFELEKCLYILKSGRPGPVWIDIPLDVQTSNIDLKKIKSYKKIKKKQKKKDINYNKIFNSINSSTRPVFVIGNGIHLSKTKKEFIKISDYFNLPVLSSWSASDIIETSHKKYIGRFGIFGDRASNFTIQNSDLIVVLGCRLSQPQTGYNLKLFSPKSKIIYVDIDKFEIKKFKNKVKISINTDLKEFLGFFSRYISKKKYPSKNKHSKWLEIANNWKSKYPVVLKKYSTQDNKINSFYFIDYLSKCLNKNACVVTDMGTSFTCTMQTLKIRKGQRIFTSPGLAAMGYGLPGAIGASFTDKKNNHLICIAGDGGFMFNLQELQTIKHYKLPIKIFVICNNGYLTMKLMQKKNFQNYVGSSPKSGISCPDFTKIARAFGIKSTSIKKTADLKRIKKILKSKDPFLCEIHMDPMQPLIPRLQTKMTKDGKFLPTPIDNLYPFLSEKEYESNIFYK